MIGNNTVILARVSSKAQEDEGYSLDSQLKLLNNYCNTNGFNVVKVFRIAETASKQQSRKILHELITYINENDVKHLAVEKTDRLTRNFRDAVILSDWMDEDENRRLHAVKENLVMHKYVRSDVNFMWGIHLAVAKKYTDNLREEAMKGWAEKLAQGWMPSAPPPGYVTATVGGKKIHVPDPIKAPLMQKIFRKYLEPGQSYASIAQEMYELGIKTKTGRAFNKSKAHKILTNPYYIGIIKFNGKEYPGAQEHLISRELYDQVQFKSHHGRPRVPVKHNAPLKGLIRCSDCHTVVTWQLQKGHYYGICKQLSNACSKARMLRHDLVEEMIINKLADLVCPSKELMNWVTVTMHQYFENNIATQKRMEDTLNDQLLRIQRMDDCLYDDKLSGEITKERYTEKHEILMSEKTQVNQQLSKLESSLGVKLKQRFAVMELTQRAAQIYPNKSPEQKRLILSKLFAEIRVSGGVISVNYTKFAEAIGHKIQQSTKLMEVPK